MAELLANNAATTLNGAIDNVVTSLTVANGAVFPATGNFRLIIDSELLLCTARATNVLTVTRGIESTSAASHSNGAAVTHIVTKGGLDQYLADNFGVWQAYTPVWTSSGVAPSLGNGSVSGSRYTQIGKTVMGQMSISFGSTTTFGTGVYIFSLPVTASALVGGGMFGTTYINDSSASQIYMFSTIFWTTTTISGFSPGTPAAALASTVPVTFASGDFINMKFIYEAA